MATATAEEADTSSVSKTADNENKEQLGKTVAQHYNHLPDTGLEARGQSRIFYMRNFNNWMKSMLIGDILDRIRSERGRDPELAVLDLCGGKGGDLQKWKKGRISRLVLADIAATSVEQAEGRYKENVERNRRERNPSKMFSAEFHTADCSKERLKDMYKAPMPEFDLTSCQFSFHYSLESYEQTEMMLRNACECLKPGGYFIGTTPNSYELVKRLKAAEKMSFGNDVYRVTFQTEDKDNLPLFGAKYDFHLEGVVDCPEFLVYFPMLEKMAEKFDMELEYKMTFADFFNKHLHKNDGRGLLGRMQALEPYPPAENVDLMSKDKTSYAKADEAVIRIKEDQEKQQSSREQDRRGPKPVTVGTLTQEEWEATTLYLIFAFKKKSPDTQQQSTASDVQSGQKRQQDDSSESGAPPTKEAKT